MKQGLPRLVSCMLWVFLVSGCVTERMYLGTDVPIKERKIDKQSAARERLKLGLTYLQRGNSPQAKANLDRAMAYAPDLEDVHIGMAYYYQSVGDVKRAETAYSNAIKLPTASGDALNNFGVFLCQEKKFDDAEKMFLTAIEHPGYTRIAASYENLGICSREAGQITKAKDYFIMALKYESRRSSTMMELIKLNIELGDYTDAKSQWLNYQQLVPDTPQSLSLGIEIEQGLQQYESAEDLAIRLLAQFPKSPQAKQYRASLE